MTYEEQLRCEVVQRGMTRVDEHDRLTGPLVENTYKRWFTMPDGREWIVEVRRKR